MPFVTLRLIRTNLMLQSLMEAFITKPFPAGPAGRCKPFVDPSNQILLRTPEDCMEKKQLNVNGIYRTVIASPEASLADVLRRQLYLTGTKVSCNDGHCGACSVILNG